MLNLPKVTGKLKGTKVELTVSVDGDLFPTRSEWLRLASVKYLSKHPEFTRADIMRYLLWLIRDKDHITFTFGDNEWNYVQFIKEGENLVLDFPYSNKFGNRRLQVDRVELILKHYGLTRFVTPFTLSTLHYDDYCFGPTVTLEASFGNKRNDLAIEVMLAIVAEVFHLSLNCRWSAQLGSQRE